jgi:hypothetical protein
MLHVEIVQLFIGTKMDVAQEALLNMQGSRLEEAKRTLPGHPRKYRNELFEI